MKIHQLEGYIQNIFLVEYSEKLLLLDGCSRADVSILKRFITEQLGRPFEQLKLVMVTHMHPDHAGGASYLQKHYPLELATGDVAGEWYQGFRGRVMHLMDLGLAYYVGQRHQRERVNLWYSPLLSTKYRLKDGDQLPGFSDWQVLFTPGHTDRDLSLYHPETQTLYVADTILRVKQKLICPFPISQPADYRASLERYRQLAVSNYLLAHGEGGEISSDELLALQQLCPAKPTRYKQFLGDLIRKKFA
ncbi:MBL fold metallo-hydrolase [Agarivorans sp. 1_MG-2023]|uniref:MBL fold metallo-hydrolase n=1 Tax=Agarivorans sp. 1_MG-2023 TaxID=3062634 RepID=UPI0026E3BC53|nr:MBL fold metallo-hydrolase [Agarivorans sp. 1_MG-2023]MDO6764858.1 MBL fold metallo-hydrolase [Agarivorans sp. 1_MG-2023]